LERLRERLSLARKALGTLEELVEVENPSQVERDAAIQRFEYTFEAVYKAAGRYLLLVEGVTATSPKGVIRSSREAGLLTDEQAVLALEMVDDRNLTVHTYNEALAEQIYSKLGRYAEIFAAWLATMEAGTP